MRKIPLTTYLQEVQSLIDNGEIETALTQLRQVLEQYPHHLQTYQLVGQALLKSGSVGTAEEFFQRVLSALPNDQFAHSGMATASEQQGKLDEALWHATRAYEQQPSNDTLRKTFFSLQHKRNGMQVDRLRLTRGTLARLYLRGGIYPQAIAEVQAALKEEPARPDLQTLLLECWWEAGNQEESRQLAQQILQDYPNNMLANRVMAKLAPETDKAEYLEKVQRMNPLLGEIGTPESSETCWLDLSGEESEFLSQQSESQMPANEAVEDTFLNDIFAQASVSPAPAVEAPAPSPDNHLPALSLPDWMLNETPTDAETPAITPDAPKVETSVDGAPERIDGELTEWLANPPSEVLTPAKSAVTQESVVEPSEIPDWLGEILSGTPEIRPDEAIASAEAQAMTPHEVSAPAEPALELQAPEELPDDDEVIPVLLPVSPEPDRAQAGDQSATALPTLDLAAIFGAVPEQPHVSEATSDTLSDDSLERTLYELSQLETQPVSVKRESPAEPLAETPMTEVVDFAGALVSDETIIEGTVAAKDMPQTALPDNAETELPPVAELPIAAETTPVSEPATGEANFIETDFYEASLPVRPDTDLPTDEKSAREFLETLFDTADSAEPAP
ncbi:MAG TPA: tetratricopeptide repeat protein, partial [Anaerolineales bacterium]|nr:tetratricopeptide repeat protein [Anaerolineales bacterium]